MEKMSRHYQRPRRDSLCTMERSATKSTGRRRVLHPTPAGPYRYQPIDINPGLLLPWRGRNHHIAIIALQARESGETEQPQPTQVESIIAVVDRDRRGTRAFPIVLGMQGNSR